MLRLEDGRTSCRRLHDFSDCSSSRARADGTAGLCDVPQRGGLGAWVGHGKKRWCSGGRGARGKGASLVNFLQPATTFISNEQVTSRQRLAVGVPFLLQDRHSPTHSSSEIRVGVGVHLTFFENIE